MQKRLLFLVFLVCFIPTSTFSQNLEINGSFVLFREAKTKEPVLIINDTLLYKGVKPIKFSYKHTDYPDKLHEYVSFNIKDKTYLVHDGCGPVLEFRNDSIVRINDAYLQRNQFKAVHFVYNDEIYFFGGYGLFTTKNILTKYIFKTKDWIEVQTYGNKVQEPRAGAFSYIKGNNLYVFGGDAKDENKIPDGKYLDNKVWRLHLPSMTWYCMGTYDQNATKNNFKSLIYDSKKLYFHSGFFLEIDYYKNKINTYKCNYITEALVSYQEGRTIIGVYKRDSKIFFHAGDISEFRGKLRSTSVFISPLEANTNYLATSSASLLILILLLFLFRKPLKEIVKPFKGIIYNQQKQVFVYKGKSIHSFEDQDKKILFYVLDHLNQYISLNELNQLFENTQGVETISATTKRREHAVSGLFAKVSKITGMDEKELMIERKNTDDKRIKDIMLLPNLLKKS